MKLKIDPIRILPIAAYAAFSFFPLTASAASILLSAENFTVLGGSGITNVVAAGTVINGNIGIAPTAETAITGFPPGLITNGFLIPTGAITTQARVDLINVQSKLAAMSSNFNLTGQDLGGLTLFPGVYTFSSSAQLTGALTLDANGQNNASWVFQIGSSLTTAAGATVSFINPGSNGGSDNGLFWNAGSAITFGASNQIKGNYLAGTSITAGNATNGDGRLLALALVALDNNQINFTGGPDGGDWTGGLTYDVDGDIVPFTSEVPFGVDSTLAACRT